MRWLIRRVAQGIRVPGARINPRVQMLGMVRRIRNVDVCKSASVPIAPSIPFLCAGRVISYGGPGRRGTRKLRLSVPTPRGINKA